jgi:hypothetical protein
MVQKPIPAGVARSLARAKKFGRAHRPMMTDPVTKKRVVRPPGDVTFTLLDSYAPSVKFPGSAHATTVVFTGSDGKPQTVATLAAGEKATFTASKNEVDGTVSWSRQSAPAPALEAKAPAAPKAPVVTQAPPVAAQAAPAPSKPA